MSGCLSCGGRTAEVVKLGDFYLPDFVGPGEPRGERYPLRLMLCDECTLLQLGDIVPRDAVIHERYGFFSGLNEQNQRDLREIAEYALRHVPEPRSWLDIGCNDGTLLGNVPRSVHRVGVDPLLAHPQFWDRARPVAHELIPGYFDPDVYAPGEFDVVTSTAMFYALPDPATFAEGVRSVLARDGVWVIQQNYAPGMLRNNTIDNVIHEHVAYYTVGSLQHLMHRHGLEICDVEYSDVKGGCFRTLVSHRGARPVIDSVDKALMDEWSLAIGNPGTWRQWAEYVLGQMGKTRSFISGWASAGRTTYCYGAGNRGGTLVQLLGADADLMPYAVERSPAKVGKVWTSAGIPIISEEQMRADNPAYLLMSPWFFRDVFTERERPYLESGGVMIFPLPFFDLVAA